MSAIGQVVDRPTAVGRDRDAQTAAEQHPSSAEAGDHGADGEARYEAGCAGDHEEDPDCPGADADVGAQLGQARHERREERSVHCELDRDRDCRATVGW